MATISEAVRVKRWYIVTFLSNGTVRWHTEKSYATKREAYDEFISISFGRVPYGCRIVRGSVLKSKGHDVLEVAEEIEREAHSDDSGRDARQANRRIAMSKKRKTKAEREKDDIFYAGIVAALGVIAIHDQGVIWREIVELCNPLELYDFAKRDDALEFAGFEMYADDEWARILKEQEGQDERSNS